MTNKKEYLLPTTLMTLTALSGLALTAPSASADTSGTVTLTVDVPASCSLTVNPSSHTVTINPGNTGLIGTSTIKSICNDPAGLAVYAVGYTNDTYGNNNLSSSVGANTINIATAVTPSGTPATSEWNMTLTAISGDYTPTITTGFDSAHIIPDVYTKVAYRNTMTDIGTNATGAQFTASFNAYIAPTQAAGTYEGKVKFLLVHPNIVSSNPTTYAPDTILVLQDVANWANDVALNQEVEAMDLRDGQMYKVKRLKMNASGTESMLWMSNLNLGAESLEVSQLDSTNTNLASGISAISASTFNSWIKTSGTYTSTDPELIPITASNSTTSSATDSYGNKYGTLYNYAAASAGTYAYESSYSGTDNATSDLCPAGWRMPTGGSTGEFQKLIADGYNVYDAINDQWNTNGFTTTQQNLGFSLAGGFYSSTPSGQGSRGIYWSSTFYSGTSMYDLGFYVDYLDPVYYNERNFAHSVRCVAEDPVYYMQDVAEWGSSVAAGQEITAIDRRGNPYESYTVARLADGNLWMTQNLDLDIDSNTTYTSTDTDIPSNWTPSTSTHTTNDNTWNNSYTYPESYDAGDIYWNGELNVSNAASSGYMSSTGNSHYHLGNYYNWTAAIASNDSSAYTSGGTLVDQSICPAGWTLPRVGTGDDSFYQLFDNYSITTNSTDKVWDSPLHFSLAGYYNGTLYRVGARGELWSSVVYVYGGGTSSHFADFYVNGNVSPSNDASRNLGYSVRCLARPVSSTITGL